MSQPGKYEDLIKAALAMVDANETYQHALATNAALLRELAWRLRGGEDVAQIVRATPGSPGRSGAKSAEELLEEARFRFRTSLISACVAAGMPTKEIAANMGYSRQLVERYVRAARDSE